MSESLQDRLIRHEGIRTAAYRDSRGFLTIGVGRCLDTEGISHDEAIYLLQNDIRNAQQKVVAAMPWVLGLDDERQEVLYEMCFQLGINGLLQFKNMISAIKGGDYAAAAREMLSSAWHTQTPARCEELADIILTGSP